MYQLHALRSVPTCTEILQTTSHSQVVQSDSGYGATLREQWMDVLLQLPCLPAG